MGQMSTYSPIYNMEDTSENWLKSWHTLDRMCLTSILEVQYLHKRLHNDDNESVMCKQTSTAIRKKHTRLFTHTIALHSNKETNPSCRGIYRKPTAYDGTTTPVTQPREYMTTMGKVDTLYLMMIIRWVMNISSRSPTLERASSTHTTPHNAKKIRKVTVIINYIFDTLPTEYSQQAFTHASGIFHCVGSMQVNKSGVACIKQNMTSRPLCIMPKANPGSIWMITTAAPRISPDYPMLIKGSQATK